jgi:hypothetical protein
MKTLLCLLLIVFFQTFVFGQTKTDEYALTDSDSESIRIHNFSLELNKQPESEGLIIIYAGENLTRAGNLFSFANGVKSHIALLSKNKVSVVVAQGKKWFFKEMWIVSAGEKKPEFKEFKFDFGALKTKLFYAFDCLSCDPAVPELYSGEVDLENYAEILKGNASYKGVIEISTGDYTGWTPRAILSEARRYAGEYRQILTQDHKIPNSRLTIKIKRSPNKDSVTTANLYIVPLKKN